MRCVSIGTPNLVRVPVMVSIFPGCKYVEENIMKALPMIMCSRKHEEELVYSTRPEGKKGCAYTGIR